MTASKEARPGRPQIPNGWTRTRLLGIPIDRLRLGQLLEAAISAAQDSIAITIVYVNIHCCNVASSDPAYRRILEDADIVYCDGTGVRVAATLTGRSIPARMTGADWIWDLARVAAERGLSIFLLGSAPGSAEAAATSLIARFPSLRIAGAASGYGAGRMVVERINASGADMLLVGMGTPRQEKWIAAHRAQIDVPVVWAVGALFDFVSGRIHRGPHWLTDHGMEWACRLVAEPRKLWRRYLIGNPQFFWRVIRHHWFHRSA
jgi:N-acetylglucosaminyldiphosphoundecaprenol N-acetyl-beta-D-mannosaminyltransferase